MPGWTDIWVGGIAPVRSAALEGAHQLAVGSGALGMLTVLNFSATARLVLLLDQIATPVGFSTTPVIPIWAYLIAGLSTTPGPLSERFQDMPIQFKNGLWVVMSTVLTNPFSCTTTATADMFVSALINQG